MLVSTPEIDIKQARRAEAVLFLLTVLWGGTFVIVKTSLTSISTSGFLAIRFSFAAVILFLMFPRSVSRLNKAVLRDGMILGILSFMGFLLQTEGLRFTTASNSGFITGTSVVFTPIIQIVIERRFPKWNNIAGVAIVCVGLYLLSGSNLTALNYGDVLTLGCAVAWSFYIVRLDMSAPRHPVVLLTLLQLTTTAILSCSMYFLAGAGSITLTQPLVASILYTALITTVLTTLLQMKYQPRTTPVRAVLIFTAEPVFAAMCGHYFLNESLTILGWAGAGLILGGVLVSELAGERVSGS